MTVDLSHPDRSSIDAEQGELARELSARTILFHQAIAERVGLSATEHKCLDLLARAVEPLTAGQLATLAGLTTGAITGIVDRLESSGFVARERSPDDRRKVYLRPLPAIHEKYGVLMAGIERANRELLARYSAEERALIADFIRNAIEILKEEAQRLEESSSGG